MEIEEGSDADEEENEEDFDEENLEQEDFEEENLDGDGQMDYAPEDLDGFLDHADDLDAGNVIIINQKNQKNYDALYDEMSEEGEEGEGSES